VIPLCASLAGACLRGGATLCIATGFGTMTGRGFALVAGSPEVDSLTSLMVRSEILARALALGYVHRAIKNCKGIVKGIANAAPAGKAASPTANGWCSRARILCNLVPWRCFK